MNAILTKIIDQYKYEVVFDDDYNPYQDVDDEWAKETAQSLNNGDLIALGVIKSKKCACCESWVRQDSLWGMLYPSAERALDEYIADHGGE